MRSNRCLSVWSICWLSHSHSPFPIPCYNFEFHDMQRSNSQDSIPELESVASPASDSASPDTSRCLQSKFRLADDWGLRSCRYRLKLRIARRYYFFSDWRGEKLLHWCVRILIIVVIYSDMYFWTYLVQYPGAAHAPTYFAWKHNKPVNLALRMFQAIDFPWVFDPPCITGHLRTYVCSNVNQEQRVDAIGRHIWFDRTEAPQARYYFEALVLEFGFENVNCSNVNDGYLIHARPEGDTLLHLVPQPPPPPAERHGDGTVHVLWYSAVLS